MYFNSFSFLIFLITIFTLYWTLGKGKSRQNILLLAASYTFYSFWDWRFLFLLLFSTLLDYFAGLMIARYGDARRKIWLSTAIIINLGFLAVFKYFNFFAESFSAMLGSFGLQANPVLLDIILPVGISFYTFHGLSYIIDIYKQRIKPESNVVDYALFVSYFPLLVAGPIERATHLLPQLKQKRVFNFELARQGILQIAWGLFKKVVVADTCATYANAVFDNYASLDALSLSIGALAFAFQIYGDFSGYSDIALGTSKLFGIELLKNFNYPYFSRDIAEFWRRWHMSLSSWFRDYLYIPLGGSRGTIAKKIRNVMIIFVVSGFWHGANWTFIAWGALNALYFIPLMVLGKNKVHDDVIHIRSVGQGVRTFAAIGLTFALTCLAWIVFRSETITDAYLYISRLFTVGHVDIVRLANERFNVEILPLLMLFTLIEWFSRHRPYATGGRYADIKLMLCLLGILLWGVFSDYKDFIYFQF